MDYYIADTALGSDTGADAENAHGASWLNSAGNWSSPSVVAGKISPGDTVHLVGTITTALTVQASGLSGGVITILFSAGAKMSAPYWASTTGAINLSRQSYITIDGDAVGVIGGYEGNSALANGVIECTDNGSALGNQVDCFGVNASECKFLTVKNLVVRNIYVRVRGGEQNAYGACVANLDTNSHGVNNFVVRNCILSDSYVGIKSDYSAGDHDYIFSQITAFNCNWGGNCSDRGPTATMEGLIVRDCYFHDWVNWDDTERNSWHHNGFFAWAASGGQLNDVTFSSIVLGPNYTEINEGETSQGNHSTSGIYVSGNVASVLMSNVLAIMSEGLGPSNAAFLFLKQGAVDFDVRVYNCTFVGGGTDSSGLLFSNFGAGTGTIDVRNNIAVGTQIVSGSLYNTGFTLTASHNLEYNVGSRTHRWASGGSGGAFDTSTWQGLGFDTDLLTGNPLLDGTTYKIGAGSPAIGAGADLSAYFTSDAAGLDRPNGSAWDLGAYQYAAISPTAPAFTVDPESYAAAVSENVTLSALASGSPTPTYQWNKDGTPITGATSSSLALYGVQPGDAASYTCTATNTEGSATSDAAVLTVILPDPGIYRFAASAVSNPLILLPCIIMVLFCSGCSTTPTGKHWYAPATWFSHAPADAADRAHATAAKTATVADTVTESVTRAAHIEIAKADVASLTLPPSRSTDLVRRFLPNGLGLLDQVQPLTAAESADLRSVVAGLLSESATTVAAAEKKQAEAESESTRLSRELVTARSAAAAAAARADAADAKLRVAFDRENILANALRAQHARFWIVVGIAFLLLIGSVILRMQLGGVGAALHAAGVPTAMMAEIERNTSAVGQWLIKTGRIAAAKTEAHLAAAAK